MDERRRVSRTQERHAAARLGARLHSGSGSGSKRHDMHNEDALIECKTVVTGNRQITLKAADLKSLLYHAAIQGKDAVLHITLDGQSWVLIPEDEYVATHGQLK
jgi:Holliday junction resolvase